MIIILNVLTVTEVKKPKYDMSLTASETAKYTIILGLFNDTLSRLVK
jgi:hypothetical protein